MATGYEEFRNPVAMGLWMALIAFLMISNVATLSWTSLRPRRNVRLELIGLVGIVFAALLLEPWWTLAVLSASYMVLMPYGMVKYGRIKRQRAATSLSGESRDGGHLPE